MMEGRVLTMKWTEEELEGFIEIFNANEVRTKYGELIKVERVDYGFDGVNLQATKTWDEEIQRRSLKTGD